MYKRFVIENSRKYRQATGLYHAKHKNRMNYLVLFLYLLLALSALFVYLSYSDIVLFFSPDTAEIFVEKVYDYNPGESLKGEVIIEAVGIGGISPASDVVLMLKSGGGDNLVGEKYSLLDLVEKQEEIFFDEGYVIFKKGRESVSGEAERIFPEVSFSLFFKDAEPKIAEEETVIGKICTFHTDCGAGEVCISGKCVAAGSGGGGGGGKGGGATLDIFRGGGDENVLSGTRGGYFTGLIVLEKNNVVSGSVKKNEPAVFQLPSDKVPVIVHGSVKDSNGRILPESTINLEIKEGEVVVTTEYYFEVPKTSGFGRSVRLDLGKTGISAPSESGEISLSIVSQEGKILGEVRKPISVRTAREGYILFVNVKGFSRNYGGILGRDVNWVSEANGVSGAENVVFEIPESAVVENIKKFDSRGNKLPLEGTEEGELGEGFIEEDGSESVSETPIVPSPRESSSKSGEGESSAPISGRAAGELGEVKSNRREHIVNNFNRADRIVLEYSTPAPKVIFEEEFDNEISLTVSCPDDVEYRDILLYKEISRAKWKIDSLSRINIKWEESSKFVTPEDVALDEQGYVKTIFWEMEHCSNQTYNVLIYLSDAEHLDENRIFISDIYDEVKERDGVWSETIPEQHYARIKFEQNLTKGSDVSVYARADETADIEIYPIGGESAIARISGISSENMYRVFLSDLNESESYRSLDLKILNSDVEFDLISDTSGEFVLIGCGILDNRGATYILQNDITTNGTCFEIAADDIVIDGKGRSIRGGGSNNDYGVLVDGVVNIEIRNLNVANFGKGIYFTAGANNSLIKNNTIGANSLSGVELINGFGNVISNNLIFNNSQNGVWLKGGSAKNVLFNNFLLDNSNFEIKDDTENAAVNFLIYNSSFGEIKWTGTFLRNLDLSGNIGPGINLDIRDNFVQLNTNEFGKDAGINSPANVTLFNIGNRGFVHPEILRNGASCGAVCNNFTSLTAQNVVFSVTRWTSYEIGGPDSAYFPEKVKVEFLASDENAGDDVNLKLKIYNYGDKEITVNSGIKIYVLGGFEKSSELRKLVEKIELGSDIISSGEFIEVDALLSTTNYVSGNYVAVATVKYDDGIEIAEDRFRLGRLFVDIISYEGEFIEDKGSIVVEIESFWNEPITGVYLSGKILGYENLEFKTARITLLPWEKQKLIGYFDTDLIKEDSFQVKLSAYYEEEISDAIATLSFPERKDYVLIGLFIGAVIAGFVLLAFVIKAFVGKKRKKK